MVQSEQSLAELDRLYEDYWNFVLKEDPRYATYLGDHRYDGELEDASEKAFRRRASEYQEYLDRLRSYSRPLAGTGRLNYVLIERELNDAIEELSFRPWLIPITQQQGAHIGVPEVVTYHPFRSVQDFGNYLSRLREFPRLVEQIIANMRLGVREKLVLPRVIVEKVVPQLKVQIVSEAEKSVFYEPINSAGKEVSAEDARHLREKGADVIQGS